MLMTMMEMMMVREMLMLMVAFCGSAHCRTAHSHNSDEYTQRAPQHLCLTKDLRSSATIASLSETIDAWRLIRAVKESQAETELSVGTDVLVVSLS